MGSRLSSFSAASMYFQPLRIHIGVSISAVQFGSWPFRMIIGPKNQRMIFSPRSVHSSVHVEAQPSSAEHTERMGEARVHYNYNRQATGI